MQRYTEFASLRVFSCMKAPFIVNGYFEQQHNSYSKYLYLNLTQWNDKQLSSKNWPPSILDCMWTLSLLYIELYVHFV